MDNNPKKHTRRSLTLLFTNVSNGQLNSRSDRVYWYRSRFLVVFAFFVVVERRRRHRRRPRDGDASRRLLHVRPTTNIITVPRTHWRGSLRRCHAAPIVTRNVPQTWLSRFARFVSLLADDADSRCPSYESGYSRDSQYLHLFHVVRRCFAICISVCLSDKW